jgi:hypothetical protein
MPSRCTSTVPLPFSFGGGRSRQPSGYAAIRLFRRVGRYAHELLVRGTELLPEPVSIGSINRRGIETEATATVVLKRSFLQLSHGVPLGAVILLWPIPTTVDPVDL